MLLVIPRPVLHPQGEVLNHDTESCCANDQQRKRKLQPQEGTFWRPSSGLHQSVYRIRASPWDFNRCKLWTGVGTLASFSLLCPQKCASLQKSCLWKLNLTSQNMQLWALMSFSVKGDSWMLREFPFNFLPVPPLPFNPNYQREAKNRSPGQTWLDSGPAAACLVTLGSYLPLRTLISFSLKGQNNSSFPIVPLWN